MELRQRVLGPKKYAQADEICDSNESNFEHNSCLYKVVMNKCIFTGVKRSQGRGDKEEHVPETHTRTRRRVGARRMGRLQTTVIIVHCAQKIRGIHQKLCGAHWYCVGRARVGRAGVAQLSRKLTEEHRRLVSIEN